MRLDYPGTNKKDKEEFGHRLTILDRENRETEAQKLDVTSVYL